MQEHCKKCDDLCTCQNWESGDLTQMVNHLISSFRFTGFELKYHSLQPGETERMLCCVGKCSRCGRRLCHGTGLASDKSTNDLLEHIYRWTFQTWNSQDQPPVHGTPVFVEIFLGLFHEEDRSLIEEWLRRPEIIELRRSCHQERLEV